MTTELPQPTTNIQVAEDNLRRHGFCLLANALDYPTLDKLAKDLQEVAAEERRHGTDFRDGGREQQWGDFRDAEGVSRARMFSEASGGVNQRVWMLVNKGASFRGLLRHPDVLQLVRSLLGPAMLLSSHGANIAREGGVEMPLHTDQWWMPPPVLADASNIPVGAIERDNVPNAPGSTPQMIAPTAAVNVIWMLVDFTEKNGATRVVPGSHRRGTYPAAGLGEEEVVHATAPAGTALVIDARIWHGTGANTGAGDRLAVLTTFCGPQFRTQENYTLGLDHEVFPDLDDHLLELLGFRVWGGYGRTANPTDEWVTPK
jgi:ectoine hydroxylase-related dioxygenase (phytanoyl-CoA dioxygenase family)